MCLLNTEEFIKRARIIHNNKFNYSKTIYKGANKEVEIICNTCLCSFYQKSCNHLKSKICCPNCILKTKRSNTKEFIEKAKLVHDDQFDYTEVDYINNSTKVIIICNKCRTRFKQTPSDHLGKHGCPNCANNQCSNTENFIKKAKKMFGKKFNYDEVEYKTARKKVKIICNKCKKSFLQRPNDHLSGYGCPNCPHRISKPETKWLNELKIPEEYRQYYIKISNKQFKVDGFDPQTNTIYEFFGDFYHGNPELYDKLAINKKTKKTFGHLYEKTMEKIKILQDAGYNIIYIWESDYNKNQREQ